MEIQIAGFSDACIQSQNIPRVASGTGTGSLELGTVWVFSLSNVSGTIRAQR